MFKKIDYILSLTCPLLQSLEMIEMMVDYRWRANRHHWTASEEVVKKNLSARLESDMRWYGHAAISDQFFDYFELNREV